MPGEEFPAGGKGKAAYAGSQLQSSLAENDLGVLVDNTGNMSQSMSLQQGRLTRSWAAEGSGES